MAAPRVLLANAAGAGRGHVVNLGHVARGFAPGADFVAALGVQTHAAELAGLSPKVIAAPLMSYTEAALADPLREGNSTWSDYLAACGFADDEVLQHGLAWWRRCIVAQDISVLVADYAPLALLAARGLRAEGWEIAIISTGTGYGCPPAHLDRFPNIMPDHDRVVHPEPEVLARLNWICAEAGLDPLTRLPALQEADLTVIWGPAELDPYSALRRDELILPYPAGGTGPAALARSFGAAADELFVYLSTTELDDPAVVEALCRLPVARRGYLPAATASVRARLEDSGMVVVPDALPWSEIAARARLVLSAGQHGTVSMAAAAGLPQVALPAHHEQLCTARLARDIGILKLPDVRMPTATQLQALILLAWHDQTLHERAQTYGATLRRTAPADPARLLRENLAATLTARTQVG